MIDKEKIKYLLLAYQNDQISKEEYIQYIEILNDERYQPLLEHVLDEQWENLNDDEVKNTSFAGYYSILTQIKSHKHQGSKIKLWPKLLIAAALFLVICGGIFYAFNGQFSFAEKEQFANDIAPGKNGAVLTLANGRRILISDKQLGSVAEEAGVKITRSKDGILTYEILNQKVEQSAYQFNTLTTSRGQQIQIRLQDGTLVFLNTESTIKYPINFINAEERKVDFTGEAYFEVAEDKKHPFIIHTDKMDTKVLGTSFNVQAYPDQTTQEVSVLTGRVNVKSTVTKENVYVTPGQKVVFKSHSNKLQAFKDIPMNSISLWRKHIIVFEDAPLPEVIATINRNYNVTVQIANKNLNNLKISAYFKELPAGQVVALVCNIINAEYKIESGTYVIR